MTIHQDIRNIISEHGKSVMVGTALPNILADVSTEFCTASGIKSIMNSFAKQGWGSKVLALESESNDNRTVKLKQISQEFAQRNGYSFSLVGYLMSCLEYGLGWNDIEPQSPNTPNEKLDTIPSDINKENHEVSDKEIINPSLAIPELKVEYLSSLESLYTKPQKNFFTIKPGYFSASALIKLHLLEEKLRLAGLAIGDDSLPQWCETEKGSFLNTNQVTLQESRKRLLFRGIIPGVTVFCAVFFSIISILQSHRDNLFTQEYKELVASLPNDTEASLLALSKFHDKYLSARISGALIEIPSQKSIELLEAHTSNLVDEGLYGQAIDWLDEKLYVFKNDPTTIRWIANKTDELALEKENVVSKEFPILLQNVKDNNGRLNSEGQKLLSKLLNVEPNNYWLNFLATKEQR